VRRRIRARWAVAVWASLTLACGKNFYKVGGNDGRSGGGGTGSGIGGDGGGGIAANGLAGTSGAATTSCEAPLPGPAPLSRLTRSELVRTMRALVGKTALEQALVHDGPALYEESPTVDVSAETIDALHRAAHLVALELTTDARALAKLAGCDIEAQDEATCKARLFDGFLTRAFRRPLTATDRGEMDAVFADGKALGGSYASGARAVIEVALQSPEVLYLVSEATDDTDADAAAASSYETVSRLAYFLTGAPPDDTLWAAATLGTLDAERVETETRRLLGSPENLEQMRTFYTRHLGLEPLSPSADAGYTEELAELTRESAFRFIESVTFGGAGTFRALMTEPTAFLNGPLAEFYGVPGIAGQAFQRASFDPAQRRGLLTHPAYLRATSPGESTRPVMRGIRILHDVLCAELPPPPPSIPVLPPPESPTATMRERLTSATQSPACRACHDSINPIGLAFESYDAFGRYRETDQGIPIDPSGTLQSTDLRGDFADALELVERIGVSREAAACFRKHWLREAYRRELDAADDCALERLSSRFDAAQGDLVELIVAVAQSANLKSRPKDL
jgi:Protein of unknown function (DUF1588)/Protein of unknown function (DUF1592)/Protein of unknown function (DUF1595)/Protein of unknown function (DUF1585)